MKLKKEIDKVFIVLIAVLMLLGGFSASAHAVGKKSVVVNTQKGTSKNSQKEKQEKEYEKWKIKKINGTYYYKQKSVRLLLDDKAKFFYNKKGKVDIEVIRNKKGKIKKIRYISKKRAEEIIKNCNTAYRIVK